MVRVLPVVRRVAVRLGLRQSFSSVDRASLQTVARAELTTQVRMVLVEHREQQLEAVQCLRKQVEHKCVRPVRGTGVVAVVVVPGPLVRVRCQRVVPVVPGLGRLSRVHP